MKISDNFEQYISLLFRENEKQNLISRRAERAEIEAHIQDSLAAQDFIALDQQNLVDLGSGAGFPALLLAIACPTLSVTLVESDLKKSDFLRQAIQELNLERVQVIRDRAENVGHNPQYREQFDLCSSRAVAGANVLLEYGLPLLKPGGLMLMWKSKAWQEEMAQTDHALELLGGVTEQVYTYTLLEEKDRTIVAIRKIAPTPEQYPRRVGIPTKRPL